MSSRTLTVSVFAFPTNKLYLTSQKDYALKRKGTITFQSRKYVARPSSFTCVNLGSINNSLSVLHITLHSFVSFAYILSCKPYQNVVQKRLITALKSGIKDQHMSFLLSSYFISYFFIYSIWGPFNISLSTRGIFDV